MELLVTIDRRAPLAFDRTPLLMIALEGMRGPRTPFSPERTVVLLPDTNPEEEESLAGALEKQGATVTMPNLFVLGKQYERNYGDPSEKK